MARHKKNQTDELDAYFFKVLQNKKIPLLPLDERWHDLFPDFRKTAEIKGLEKKLNKLIQQEGQNNNDIKEYEKAKKVLMNNIVANMTDGHESDSPMRALKQNRNQRLLDELKEKQQEAERLKRILPKQIENANKELLIACMRVCYRELLENSEMIESIDAWIQEAREELKEQILRKQDMEMRNTQMYKYMHNLLGAQVVEIFDRKHKVWKGNLEENHID